MSIHAGLTLVLIQHTVGLDLGIALLKASFCGEALDGLLCVLITSCCLVTSKG